MIKTLPLVINSAFFAQLGKTVRSALNPLVNHAQLAKTLTQSLIQMELKFTILAHPVHPKQNS